MIREIESTDELVECATSGLAYASVVLQGLDLHGYAPIVRELAGRVGRLVLFGCKLEEELQGALLRQGAIVLPPLHDLPVSAYRPALYGAEELYAGLERGYEHTTDAKVYRWYKDPTTGADLLATLGQAIHDQSMSDALDELLEGRRVVGIMGGHAMRRGTSTYLDAARLGRSLARAGLTVATGGGPGAMEAANLGAWMAEHEDGALEEAAAVLAEAPAFVPDITGWARAAFRVRARWPRGGELVTVSIPTWFYGHEPPNAFATHVAKYFQNAIREDLLVTHARAGIAFLPGAAGTVQEIFQEAAQNYYGRPSPMVLIGVDHWTTHLPAWPLLSSLARDRAMSHDIALVETIEEASAFLTR